MEADSESSVQSDGVAAQATRRYYVDSGLLQDAGSDVKAIANIMDLATSVPQTVSYLNTLSRALDKLSRLRCDLCRPRWKSIGSTAKQIQNIIDAVHGTCVRMGNPDKKVLSTSLIEALRGVEKCVMETLVTFAASLNRTKRRRDVVLEFLRRTEDFGVEDLAQSVEGCHSDFQSSLRFLKEKLGVDDVPSQSNLVATFKLLFAMPAEQKNIAGGSYVQTVASANLTTLEPIPAPSGPLSNAVPTQQTELDSLWDSALDEYKRNQSTSDAQRFENFVRTLPDGKVDLDAIFDMIGQTSSDLTQQRQRSETLRVVKDFMTPILHGLTVILDAGAETASSLGVPGGKGIFAAVAMLLQAADRARATLDDLQKLLRFSSAYINHLRIRVVAHRLRPEARALAIEALVKILKIFAIATQKLREGSIERFLKALFTGSSNDMSIELRELRDIIDEEQHLIIIEGFGNMIIEFREVHAAQARTLDAIAQQNEMNQSTNTIVHGVLAQKSAAIDQQSATMGQIAETNARLTEANAQLVNDRQKLQEQLLSELSTSIGIQDQERVMAALMMLVYLAAACVSVASSEANGSPSLALAVSRNPAHVLAAFLPMAFSFLYALRSRRLRSIAPSVGVPPGIIRIIDVFGNVLPPLTENMFSTLEGTHSFLLEIFKNQPEVLSYVRKHDYGLGDSEHLLIPRAEWGHIVKPDAVLNMGIILRNALLRCPYCQTPATGDEKLFWDGRVICSHRPCGRPYGKYLGDGGVSTARVESVDDDLAIPLDEQLPGERQPPVERIPEVQQPIGPHVAAADTMDNSMSLFQRIIVEFAKEREMYPIPNARGSASQQSPNRNAHFEPNLVASVQTYTRSPESEPDSPPLRTPPTVLLDRAPSSRSPSASSDDYDSMPLAAHTVTSPLPLTPGAQLPALIPTHMGRLSLHPIFTANLEAVLSDSRRVDQATRAADATRPSCIKLRVRGPGLLWECRAVPDDNGRTVTVNDLLSSLNAFFERAVAREDYDSLLGETREAVKRAFAKRIGHDEILRSRGIVRRDFLQGRRIVALAPSDREDTVMLVLGPSPDWELSGSVMEAADETSLFSSATPATRPESTTRIGTGHRRSPNRHARFDVNPIRRLQ